MAPRLRTAAASLVSMVGLVASLGSCAGDAADPTEPGEQDPSQLYWRLTLNQRAINLSTLVPYDTFRLIATPRRVDGSPLEGTTTTTFTSAAPAVVQVGSDGLVRGLGAATDIRVIVSTTRGNVTHSDTALVRVITDPPPVLARLSLEPWILYPSAGVFEPTDSAKGGMDGVIYYQPRIVARAVDDAENELSDLVLSIESSDPVTARYHAEDQTLELRRPGPVTFYASTVAYGTAHADTLEYRVGLPLWASIGVQANTSLGGETTYRFNAAPTITVGVGAYVWWTHPRNFPMYDVTFDDPTNVAADTILAKRPVIARPLCILNGNSTGDISPWGDTTGNASRNRCPRHFPVPGIYHYHSATPNASGTIVVKDESE